MFFSDYIPAADYEPPAADYVESQPEYFEEPSPDETPVQMDYAEPESDYPEPSVEDYNEPIATTDILDTVESEAADALLQPGDAGGGKFAIMHYDQNFFGFHAFWIFTLTCVQINYEAW